MAKFLIIIILLFGAVFIGIFNLKPEWEKFQQLRAERNDLDRIAAELDEIAAKRAELLDLINTLPKEKLDQLDTALPTEPNTGNLLITLEHFASQNGVALKSVNFTKTDSGSGGSSARSGQPASGRSGVTSAVSTGGPITEFPFDMNISGSYESMKRFVQALEGNLRVIDVRDISFSSDDDATQALDVTLRAVAYYAQ